MNRSRSPSPSSTKKVISTDTSVETKTVQAGPNSVQHITITTTKKTFSDGSSSTSKETKTVTETRLPETTKIITTSGNSSSPKTIKHERSGRASSSDSSDSSDDDGEEFSTFQQQALKAHNDFRKQHGAPPLTLNKKLCKISQKWANAIAAKGKLDHSDSSYGENVYWTSGVVDKGDAPVSYWYSELKDYKFDKNDYQPNTGHFSQVVWKASTELGIAKAAGNGGTFVVANYNPAGNYQGQYLKNVAPHI